MWISGFPPEQDSMFRGSTSLSNRKKSAIVFRSAALSHPISPGAVRVVQIPTQAPWFQHRKAAPQSSCSFQILQTWIYLWWWYTMVYLPLWKMMDWLRHLGFLFPIDIKIRGSSHHQPDMSSPRIRCAPPPVICDPMWSNPTIDIPSVFFWHSGGQWPMYR